MITHSVINWPCCTLHKAAEIINLTICNEEQSLLFIISKPSILSWMLTLNPLRYTKLLLLSGSIKGHIQLLLLKVNKHVRKLTCIYMYIR